MASPCVLRIKKDIAEFFADPPPGIFIAPEESDVTKINALVVGPEDTPYEGGFFRLHLTCPVDYPMSPPSVMFLTTDVNRVKFNPHIFSNGKICLSILGTWSGPAWTPALSLGSLLVSIQSLLNQNPYYDEAVKIDDDTATRYRSFILHETIRVAVCDAVDDCLKEGTSFPVALRNVVLKRFTELYNKYEDMVNAHLHLSGSMMDDPFSNREGTYQYKELLVRLQGLKERVAKESEPSGVTAAS